MLAAVNEEFRLGTVGRCVLARVRVCRPLRHLSPSLFSPRKNRGFESESLSSRSGSRDRQSGPVRPARVRAAHKVQTDPYLFIPPGQLGTTHAHVAPEHLELKKYVGPNKPHGAISALQLAQPIRATRLV